MENVIAVSVIVIILGLAIWYIIRAKKSGKKCIGCPDGCCSAKKDSACTCCCVETKKK